MVSRGLRVLGVIAFVVPLSCGPEDEPAADGAAGSSGGTGGGGAGRSGSGGSVSSGGTAGKGGLGGTGGAASGGRAGSSAGGSDSVGGSGGRAGGDSSGGTGGDGTAGGAGDSTSSGDGGEAGATNGDSIRWNDEGVISTDTNDFGIQGTWFIENDCADANPAGLPCTVPEPTMIGPDMRPGWTTSADRVCAKGVAAQIVNDPGSGMPAYSLQWGVRLGFELNGTTSGTRGAYDAVMRGLRGLRFDITSSGTPTPPTLRVNFVTTSTTDDDAHFIEVALPAVGQDFLFNDALQGSWISAPVVLDKAALTAVTFQVYTNTSTPKPFDFCVSNARVVR